MTTSGSAGKQENAHSPEAVAFIPECVMTDNRQKTHTRTDEWVGQERKETAWRLDACPEQRRKAGSQAGIGRDGGRGFLSVFS